MFMPCSIEPPAHYYEMVQPYRDEFGLITQQDESMDGGDAAHRAGVFYFGMYLRYADNKVEISNIKKRFLSDFEKLRVKPGQYVRHPDSTMWYSNPANFSRDQTTPVVIALGAFGEKTEIKASLDRLISAFSFYPNKLKNWTNEEKVFPFDFQDIAGPSDWGMYIRALNDPSYYSYLYFTDLQILGNAFVRVFVSYWDPEDTSDDVNYSILLLQADHFMPTFLSKFSKWFYTQFRRVSPFASESTKQNAVASAWEYYFTHLKERPPLHKVYECALHSYSGSEEKYFTEWQEPQMCLVSSNKGAEGLNK